MYVEIEFVEKQLIRTGEEIESTNLVVCGQHCHHRRQKSFRQGWGAPLKTTSTAEVFLVSLFVFLFNSYEHFKKLQ